ncbi:MAG TPA: tetratricopeptide repeat protein [Thermomicrobiales bacterium]|nr:tetratricopeptide repeat protein [Thermomicrobiales bacterium]
MANSKQKPITKKQLNQQALEASLESRWEDALKINDQILERFPREAEALNRKGRALIELRQLSAARDAYSEALKADPANMIARRNLQRLETLHNRPTGQPEGKMTADSTIPKSTVFVEEIGKTWVDELANPAEPGQLAEVSPGDKLQLKVEGERLLVLSDDGVQLGEIEMRVASRVIKLMGSGNEFEAYALGMSAQSLRIILRETFRHQDNEGLMTFPRQIRATQDLMREREQLSLREEGDFDFGVEDEDVEDEAEDEEPDEVDEEASAYVGNAGVSDMDDEEDAQ